MNVLVLHTLPPDHAGVGRWEWEFDLQGTAAEIAEALPEAITRGVRGEPREMLEVIESAGPVIIFNLCEAPLCDPRLEPHAAALFEWLHVRFTGSRSTTLELCRRKDLTKHVLRDAGVRVPRSDGFPCIVKPRDEDGSAGIDANSVCSTSDEVAAAISRAQGPVIVEEFLPGREFVVSMWGERTPECVVIGEIVFSDGVRLLTYEGKWDMESHGYVNAPLIFGTDIDGALETQLIEMATRAWTATGVRGYATVDLRVGDDGTPCVIDVNPNAALNSEGRVYRAAESAGWEWSRFLRQQLQWAT